MLAHIALLKGITNSRESKEVVEAMLHRCNLYEVRKKALTGYSGGMRQRFGIAQALIGNPHLLIVDEPTAGLDPGERNRFYNLLAEIGAQVIVLAKAAGQAKSAADALAASLKLKLTRLESVEEGQPVIVSPPCEITFAKLQSTNLTPISPGAIDVHADVDLTYEVAPAAAQP